ncbi:hypothetical protein [Streptomyces sp. NPDC054940]
MSDTQTSAPSHSPGMGSMPYEDGAAFRVWAPHARAVRVTGSGRDDMPCSGMVGLGPYSALVLSQEA